MKRSLAVLAAALVLGGSAMAATVHPWHIVKTVTANSTTSMTDIDVTIRHPGQIAIRVSGRVTANTYGWVCVRGTNVTSDIRQVDKPGLFTLSRVRGASSCEVNASIMGAGPIKLQLLKRN